MNHGILIIKFGRGADL